MIHRPILRADGLGYDFPGVFYSNTFERTGEDEAQVVNILSGPDVGPFVRAILNNGAWVSEIRSPHTLYSEYATYQLDDLTVNHKLEGENTDAERSIWEYSVKWDPAQCTARPFLITQLCAHEQIILEKEILSFVWQDGPSSLIIPKGRVLARGKVFALEEAIASILEFMVDKNMTRDGEIRVAEPDPSYHFKVFMTKATLQSVKRERRSNIMIAALVGALSRLKKSDDPAGSQVLGEMAALLQKANVPTWMDEDYDPAQAATFLEPFMLLPEGMDE